MLKKSLLGTEGNAGVEGKSESSFKETLNVVVAPHSAVSPEGSLMSKISLAGAVGGAGGAGTRGAAFRLISKVELSPVSEVCPVGLLMV